MIEQRQPARWLKPLVILIVLAGGAVLLRLTVLRPQAIPVTVHRVEIGRVEDTVVNSRAGTVQSRRRSQMSPGIAGLVVDIPAKKGGRAANPRRSPRFGSSDEASSAESVGDSRFG